MEARLKMRKTDERMVMEGGVSQLQVSARRLGAGGAAGAPRYLLAPADLSLALSQPPGQGMHVDIALTDIKITVSPGMCSWCLLAPSQPPSVCHPSTLIYIFGRSLSRLIVNAINGEVGVTCQNIKHFFCYRNNSVAKPRTGDDDQ